jgi:hypothetical protein
VGKTKRGKGSKIMAIADRQGLPGAVHVEKATLANRFVRQLRARLIGDELRAIRRELLGMLHLA